MNLLGLRARKSVQIVVIAVVITMLVFATLLVGRVSTIEVVVFNNTGHSAHIAVYVDGVKVVETDIEETTFDATNLTFNGGFQGEYHVKRGPHVVRIESGESVYSETVKFGLFPDNKFVVFTFRD